MSFHDRPCNFDSNYSCDNVSLVCFKIFISAMSAQSKQFCCCLSFYMVTSKAWFPYTTATA